MKDKLAGVAVKACAAGRQHTGKARSHQEVQAMRPSIALDRHREAIRSLAEQHRVLNPRVFGSVLDRSDRDDSDLDILVDPSQEATLLNVAALQAALERLLGVRVDVLTPAALPQRLRRKILAEAKPL